MQIARLFCTTGGNTATDPLVIGHVANLSGVGPAASCARCQVIRGRTSPECIYLLGQDVVVHQTAMQRSSAERMLGKIDSTVSRS